MSALLKNKWTISGAALTTSILTAILTPILVLLSYFFTPVALALTAFLSALIVYDGESNWLEGLALTGLYVMIAISFWWG